MRTKNMRNVVEELKRKESQGKKDYQAKKNTDKAQD